MRLRVLWGVCFFWLTQGFLLAQPDEEFEVNKEPEAIPSTVSPHPKKYNLSAGFGFIAGSVPGYHLNADYTLNPDIQLGLSYMSGRKNLGVIDQTNARAEDFYLEMKLILLRAKYFLTKTFYLSVLGGERNGLAHFFVTSKSVQNTGLVITDYRFRSYGLGASVGNQWSWDNGLFINGDWIGYFVPLTSQSSATTETSGVVSAFQQSLQNDAEAESKRIGNVPSPTLMVLSVGYAF